MAVHPFEPWLAAACTDADDERGAVLVFDVQAGALLSATAFDGHAGWSDNRDLLRWHPDGARLATNVDTNGIAVLDRGRLVGCAYPDETRDSGVGHVWIGDQIFADTGALFTIHEEDQFEFETLAVPELAEMTWNAAIGAVVGRSGTGLAAFDPRNRRIYEVHPSPPGHGQRWSRDGRWCALVVRRTPPEFDILEIYSGDDGRRAWTVQPSSPRIDGVRWADEALLVSCHAYEPRTGAQTQRRVDVVRRGRVAATTELGGREIQASMSVPEASGVAPSPTGDGFALLLDRQEVQILDARTGTPLLNFYAPASAIPAGLPGFYRDGHRPEFGFPGDLLWVAPQRLAPHFVAVWSLDGSKLAELVAPDIS